VNEGAWIHRALPATRHRDFNYLFASTTASSIALWTALLGNAWVVFQLSDSSTMVALAVFAAMVPFVLAPIGGVIADKVERRHVLVVTRVAAFLVAVVLMLLAFTDWLVVWMVVGLALVQGMARTAETPAEAALSANVVPQEHIGSAVVLMTTTRLGSRAVGPIIAGPLLGTVGVEGAYAVAVIATLFSFAMLFPIRTRARGGVQQGDSPWKAFRVGLSYTLSNRPVFSIMAIVVAHCALTMSFDAMLPAYADNHLHDPTRGFALLSLGVGMGAFIGSAGLSFMRPGMRRGTVFLGTALISGLSPVMMAVTDVTLTATATATVMGASQAMTMAMAGVFLQEVVDDSVRGRVMSLYLMSAGGIMAFSNLGLGTLADITGAPVLFMIPGLIFVAIVLVSIVMSTDLRRIYGNGTVLRVSAAA
jgi:MFS family permease